MNNRQWWLSVIMLAVGVLLVCAFIALMGLIVMQAPPPH
jgi:hypothetical protein